MFLDVCSSFAWLFKGLYDVLGRVEHMDQSSSRAVPHTFETTDTSSDKTEGSEPWRRFFSKQTSKMKNVRGRMSWAGSLWLGQRMHPVKPVIFTAAFAEKMCLSWHMEFTRYYATTRGPSAFHGSASSFGNSRLASPWFRRQLYERGRSWAAAGADLEGCTSSEG